MKKSLLWILTFLSFNIFILITLSIILSNYIEWYNVYKRFGDLGPFWGMFDGKCMILVIIAIFFICLIIIGLLFSLFCTLKNNIDIENQLHSLKSSRKAKKKARLEKKLEELEGE